MGSSIEILLHLNQIPRDLQIYEGDRCRTPALEVGKKSGLILTRRQRVKRTKIRSRRKESNTAEAERKDGTHDTPDTVTRAI